MLDSVFDNFDFNYYNLNAYIIYIDSFSKISIYE